MNVSRGLLRAWIVISVLWIGSLGAMAYWTVPDSLWKRWQYVHEVRQDIDLDKVDWTRPYYDTMLSPSAEKLTVSFAKLDYGQWDKYVSTMTIISFPDSSELYLDASLTEADKQYIARAFWVQRWWRYLDVGKPWLARLLGPPIALLALGWALLWVGRGFRVPAR
jgi:hypothetical protein